VDDAGEEYLIAELLSGYAVATGKEADAFGGITYAKH
jgi:hypothetical protein